MGCLLDGVAEKLEFGCHVRSDPYQVGSLIAWRDESAECRAGLGDAVPEGSAFDGSPVPNGVDDLALGGTPAGAGEEGDEVEFEPAERWVPVHTRNAEGSHDHLGAHQRVRRTLAG